MKLYTALVNATNQYENHCFTYIRLLLKRHHRNSSEPWTYTALVEYGLKFDDPKNAPISFESNLDWDRAARGAFELYIRSIKNAVIECVQKVEF